MYGNTSLYGFYHPYLTRGYYAGSLGSPVMLRPAVALAVNPEHPRTTRRVEKQCHSKSVFAYASRRLLGVSFLV